MMLVLVGVLGFVLGLLAGLWTGLQAYAAQRDHMNTCLYDMYRKVIETADQTPQGLLTPASVIGWLAFIQHQFPPSRKWSSN